MGSIDFCQDCLFSSVFTEPYQQMGCSILCNFNVESFESTSHFLQEVAVFVCVQYI